MRRQHGEGSIHPRPNGTWCGQIDLGYVSGKRRRKTVYGRTQTEVQKKLRALRRQLEDHGDLPTENTTLTKWLTYWLDEIAAKRLKPNTFRSYKTAVTQHIVPAIGDVRLDRLSAAHVRAMHSHITGRGLSSTTARNAHRILATALKNAVEDNRIGRNIATAVQAPPKAAATRKDLTAKEAFAVLTCARSLDQGGRWWAAFLLGLRQGERLGMRWSALDEDSRTLDLAWSLQRVSYAHGCAAPCGRRPASCPNRRLAVPAGFEWERLAPDSNLILMRPKTVGSRRVLPIVDPLWDILTERRRQVEAERPNYAADYDLVWCRPDGQPIDPREDWLHWRAVLALADVHGKVQHETRHTAATMLLELGVDQETIGQILGHSSVVTTRIYQHADLTRPRAALELLSQRLLELPS